MNIPLHHLLPFNVESHDEGITADLLQTIIGFEKADLKIKKREMESDLIYLQQEQKALYVSLLILFFFSNLSLYYSTFSYSTLISDGWEDRMK